MYISLDESVHTDGRLNISTCELFAFNTGDFIVVKKDELGC